jgi:hypothetical protein
LNSKDYKEESSGGAKSSFSGGSPLSAEIAIEGIDCGFEHHMAVGAGFKVALDLDLHGRRESPF